MFLSPEEKLLALRKKYKITQGELVGEDITRVFLGMIEIGKRSLTEKTAKLLCKNFHKILEKRGINEKISINELMKTKEQQAIEFLNNMLASEINISNENLWIIEEALYELEPKERSEFCEKLYIRFKNRKRYELSRDYLLKSFHGVRKIKNLRDKLLDMFFLCEKLGDPQGAISVYKKFVNWLPKEKLSLESERLSCAYVKALIEVEAYTEAFDVASALVKKTKNDITIYIARNLIARIYKEKGEITEAVKEYASLAKGREPKEKALAYCEIIKIGLEISDKNLIKKYYEKCRLNFNEYTESSLDTLNIMCVLARGAKELGKIKDAKTYYMEALVIGRTLENTEEKRVNIIGELFDVVEKSDFYSVQSIENEYLELLGKVENCRPALKILSYYEKLLPNELSKKFELFIK